MQKYSVYGFLSIELNLDDANLSRVEEDDIGHFPHFL